MDRGFALWSRTKLSWNSCLLLLLHHFPGVTADRELLPSEQTLPPLSHGAQGGTPFAGGVWAFTGSCVENAWSLALGILGSCDNRMS